MAVVFPIVSSRIINTENQDAQICFTLRDILYYFAIQKARLRRYERRMHSYKVLQTESLSLRIIITIWIMMDIIVTVAGYHFYFPMMSSGICGVLTSYVNFLCSLCWWLLHLTQRQQSIPAQVERSLAFHVFTSFMLLTKSRKHQPWVHVQEPILLVRVDMDWSSYINRLQCTR